MANSEYRKYKKTQRFYDDKELEDLIFKARNQETSGQYKYIEKLSPEEAMEEIVQRFLNLTDSLLRICFTGRVFMRGAAADFMRKWTKSNFLGTAVSLKKELGDKYSPEELQLIARIAIVEAVTRTKTNLQATIVTCLKDRLYPLTKGMNSHLSSTYDDGQQADVRIKDPDFKIQLECLPIEEQEEIENFFLEGKPLTPELSEKLRSIFKDWM